MEILVPIFICAIMPIAIVLIIAYQKMTNNRQRANIIIKAIETNNNIDADKLAESLRKPQRTPLQILNLRLLRGCIFTLLGIGLVVFGLISNASGAGMNSDLAAVSFMLGFISFSVGASYLIVYFVTRKQVDKENISEGDMA